MRDAVNIAEVAAIGPDYMGFIFYSRSPRYFGDPDAAVIANLPESVKPVMVTVDMQENEILSIAGKYGFQTVQLHGNESPELCDSLRRRGFTVIKAVGIEDGKSLERLRPYSGHVDIFLLDTKCRTKGGSGKKFDWRILESYDLDEDFWLSGGIGDDDSEALRSLSHPHLKGIDLNSRFETVPGIKDAEKLYKFKNKMVMNRLSSLLQKKNKNLLSVYFTAGYPEKDSTVEVMDALCKGNVDMIEVGIPFSDPMADGPVIQESGTIALRNGMTLSLLLDQVAEARRLNAEVPFIAMGYLNPIMQMGAEAFFRRGKEAGIDAVIIPDLPFDIYLKEYKELSRKYDIPMIMLITPETSDERIHLIDDHCDGFIYMVSAASTTGARDSFDAKQLEYFKRIDGMDLKHPRLIGFGISNATTYDEACRYSSGAIIGSQFIKCLKSASTASEAVSDLLARIGRLF